jgi:hypothetical protein
MKNHFLYFFSIYIGKYFLKKIKLITLLYIISHIFKNYYFTFFFEKKDLENCKHYGILIYDYPDSFINFHKYGNIGDYIQSIASLQFIPNNCNPIFVDRDLIQYYHGPKIKLIINGWFRIQEGNKFCSDEINPLMISYHISNNNKDNRMIKFLKKNQPIGCRDYHTYKFLSGIGVKSYFSSCITTTLNRKYFNHDSIINKGIIFTDYKFGEYSIADNYIKNLKAYNFSNITYLTHLFNTNLTQLQRFKLAYNILQNYSKAKLVITTRIHAALPCLSLRTPVIFINKKFDIRYRGLYEFFNTIGINSQNKFEINVKLNKAGLVINKDNYLRYSLRLKKIIFKKLKL